MSDFVQEISDATKYARDTAWAEMQAADTDERRREVLNRLSAATFILGRKYQRGNGVEMRGSLSFTMTDALLRGEISRDDIPFANEPVHED